MNVSHAIMAHGKRAHFVNEYLIPRMPTARVVWDRHDDRWDTGRRSLLAYDPAATWHVVTQDDVILCRDYVASVERALGAVPPDRPVGFYVGSVRPRAERFEYLMAAARYMGRHWIEDDGPWWGPAVAIPVPMIEELVAGCDLDRGVANYDMRMVRYFQRLRPRVSCWYAAPSLVDHRTGAENPSLVPGRSNSAARVAQAFIGADVSGAEGIEWRTPAVTFNEALAAIGAPRHRGRNVRPRVPRENADPAPHDDDRRPPRS